MKLTICHAPGQIKKFKRTLWRFQATFTTPLKQLDFVSTILTEDQGFEGGSVTIEEFVFEPQKLNALLIANSLSPDPDRDTCIAVQGKTQVSELLKVMLSDWIDFAFIPSPKPFMIYADHDEFTTFFANTKTNLNRVTQPLLAAGFEQIVDYQREF